MGLTEKLFFCRRWTWKFSREQRCLIVECTEKRLLSQIGAFIENMNEMKKIFFFIELKEAKVACRNLTCLHDFCGHLKLSC